MSKKLTDDEVERLRTEYAAARADMLDDENVGDIDAMYGRAYGLSAVSVAKITSGQTYRHAPGPRVPRPGQGRRRVTPPATVAATHVHIVDDLGNVLHDAEYAGNVRITTTPTIRTTETNEETA